MFFTVYELHTVTDPDTGKPLTVKSKKGVIQVVSVDEKSSTANVVSGTVKELELVESE